MHDVVSCTIIASMFSLACQLNLSLSHTEVNIIQETLTRFKIAIDKLSEHIQIKDPQKALKGDLMKPTFSVRT